MNPLALHFGLEGISAVLFVLTPLLLAIIMCVPFAYKLKQMMKKTDADKPVNL
ncbi:hypothetical protein ACFL54_03345 [Planctomycetota bacterium]